MIVAVQKPCTGSHYVHLLSSVLQRGGSDEFFVRECVSGIVWFQSCIAQKVFHWGGIRLQYFNILPNKLRLVVFILVL